jgi:endonuclease YncB( thermonuclease family)
MRLCFVALTAMVVIANSANAGEFLGIPRVVDGDTLTIGAAKIRLQGIDAPETDQVCLHAGGQQWTCGLEARDRLAAHIAGREIRRVSLTLTSTGESSLCAASRVRT